MLGRCIFPTCQVRVVRFYQSCSSASSSSFSSSASSSSSSSSFSSTMSASTSTSTSALPTLRQLPRAVGTAGRQLPASALPTLCQGSLKATFAYDSLTDCLRRAYGNFQSLIRNSVNFGLMFKQYRFPYMQWHNGIINHRHSIACNSMHQMKHTTLFEPQLSWPDMGLRTAYGHMFMTNAYVKPFALLTKPRESLTTRWSLCKPNTKQVRGTLERCSIGRIIPYIMEKTCF